MTGPTADGAGDDALADALASVILGEGHDVDGDHLALVARAAAAVGATERLLQQAIDSARGAGASWADIGGVLGISRQAAQQRFGGSTAELEAPNERWLGPVTAFDEMAELELAGRMGWHTIGAGLLRHRMVRTPTQWEHRRVTWRGARSLEVDGWQVGARSFPWVYLVRDTGRPADA